MSTAPGVLSADGFRDRGAQATRLEAFVDAAFAFALTLVVIAGNLSGYISNSGFGNPWFDALERPDIFPDPMWFGIVWTILYVMMGVALSLIVTARGAMLRAYDKQTGKEVGAVFMPSTQSGSPMTYMVGGKQYIIVPTSGGNASGEFLAYALPGKK